MKRGAWRYLPMLRVPLSLAKSNPPGPSSIPGRAALTYSHDMEAS